MINFGTNHLINNFNNYHELLFLAVSISALGLIGFLESKNFLEILIFTELILLGLNFIILTVSISAGSPVGQAYVLCVLATTAAETAVGLGILILLYRTSITVEFTNLNSLRG